MIDTTASVLYLVVVIFRVPQMDYSSCHMKTRTGRMDVCYPRIENTKGHGIHWFNGRSDGTLDIYNWLLKCYGSHRKAERSAMRVENRISIIDASIAGGIIHAPGICYDN